MARGRAEKVKKVSDTQVLTLSRVEVKENTTSKNKITYGYDADTGRREWITNGVYKAKYEYDNNSSLISSVEFYSSSTKKMTTLKDYDFLNRVTSVDSEIESSGKHIGFGYQYNLASQRTRISREDGSYWKYGYDSIVQVISGQRYWGDGTRVVGQQFGYDYDDIGNRIKSYAGGDVDGSNMRVTGYTNNIVNELTDIDLSGYVEIQGVAPLSSTVNVNSQAADRQGEYYRKELNISTTGSAAYTDITVSGTGLTSTTGKVFTPKDPVAFTNDFSGNLTNDGRWDYVWDAENRLVEMSILSNIASTFTNLPAYELTFQYDPQGRRIEKKVYNDASTLVEHKKYVYDGWNLLMEIDAITSPKTSELCELYVT